MNLSAEELDIQLNWFVTAFPIKYRISLSKAKQIIEESLSITIPTNVIYSYLKIKGYKNIQVDIEISDDNVLKEIINEDLSIVKKPKENDDLSIEEILSLELIPNRISAIPSNLYIKSEKEFIKSYSSNLELLELYAKTKSKEAFEQVLYSNQRLIWKIVKQYLNYSNHDLSEEDLVAEGNIGLIKAIQKFDLSYDTKFSTYAIHWIRQAITRAIIDKGRIVRIPVYAFELIQKIKKIEANYFINNKKIIPSDICRELNITEKKYEFCKLIEYRFLNVKSLNSFVREGDTETDTELLDFLPNDRFYINSIITDYYEDPAQIVDSKLFVKDMLSIINKLSERQQKIISLRFGLEDDSPMTLEEIGSIYGLTRERIRQIEYNALKKIKSMAIVNGIKWNH
ncbi:sigma-70 family RNA polymerase sigma factor [Paenibacillus hunanensis]|uniref:RNA polymerase primary sigma factor n=1 Tax=Paenibacillus hunanensis TaxID=539262 RepID=A0ABU1J5H9_9BACL|nr:RNA polymerase sigma factor RpoD/SigA [Paenibacillus hunanensis]MDR6246753.1 RNA polymerase primary sigma factor [Paenibacillus hunanensis]GGJ33034.1 hypothetical protein GCM10008022_47170 [Paenibacillus hunanensis]